MERIQRLVKNEILPYLDFTDLGVCVDCIKGKHPNHKNKNAPTRSMQPLDIIHTEICGPFNFLTFRKEKYFITFIDNCSRYDYIYLFHESSQSINALEVFVNEVEKQLDKKMKIMRSDKGGDW